MIELTDEIAAQLGTGDEAFDRIFALAGQRFRFHESRETLRVEIGGHGYFLKRHYGYGWKRILRSLFTGGFPVVSSRTEKDAIRHLQQAGIPSIEVVGFGERGLNPATRQSFLMTRELVGCHDLKELCEQWKSNPPAPRLRRSIIEAVADTTRNLHASGMNHRDLYLAHFWLDEASATSARPRLHVIDLHRAMQHRRRVPLYWLTKDLAALLLSAWESGLSRTDCLRFVARYRGRPARDVLRDERKFWQLVVWRARWVFPKVFQRDPPFEIEIPRAVTPRSERQRIAA